jgi:3',5'-nucleoside bisphosphate phosphatase
MKKYRADLHIHTLLSPCGDLEMSPDNIVLAAKNKGLDIIAITDHNTTRQGPLIAELGAEAGIFVICGAEVTSKEETHCLSLFPDLNSLEIFQNYLDRHLTVIPNDPARFGYQVQVDRDENIVYEEKRLLIPAISQSIDEIEKTVHQLNGLFIPAHINRSAFGLISQLGFVPDDLKYDALEISKHTTVSLFLEANPYLKGKTFIQNSDAHFPEHIGEKTSFFHLHKPDFDEIRLALKNSGGRFVSTDTD